MNINNKLLIDIINDIKEIESLPEIYHPENSFKGIEKDILYMHMDILTNEGYLKTKRNDTDDGAQWVIISITRKGFDLAINTFSSIDTCAEMINKEIELILDNIKCYRCNSKLLERQFDSKLIVEVKEGITFYRRYALLLCENCSQIHTIDIKTTDIDIPDLDIICTPNVFKKFPFNYKKIGFRYLELSENDISRNKIDKLFSESIKCYEENNHILCAIGVRAILEQICKSTNRKADSLQRFLEKLRNVELISEDEFKLAEKFKDSIGNYAAHDATEPSDEDLIAFFNLTDYLIDKFFRSKDRLDDLTKKNITQTD
ncbi:DUF4145 domain-containing protein [Vibrio parahaemolyticus]|uniref:DUF4145 domain-containing protein n=1 Tax=Vibrio parahaemolyticus TaxID=670 RepID=UPI003D7E84F7